MEIQQEEINKILFNHINKLLKTKENLENEIRENTIRIEEINKKIEKFY